MRVIIFALAVVLMGCGQVKPNANVGSLEQFEARRLDEKQAANLASLEAKIDALTGAVAALQKSQSVHAQDREEVLAFNRCQDTCNTAYPWPEVVKGWSEERRRRFWELPWVVKVQEDRHSCYKECDKIKPKAQPDWSC